LWHTLHKPVNFIQHPLVGIGAFRGSSTNTITPVKLEIAGEERREKSCQSA